MEIVQFDDDDADGMGRNCDAAQDLDQHLMSAKLPFLSVRRTTASALFVDDVVPAVNGRSSSALADAVSCGCLHARHSADPC